MVEMDRALEILEFLKDKDVDPVTMREHYMNKVESPRIIRPTIPSVPPISFSSIMGRSFTELNWIRMAMDSADFLELLNASQKPKLLQILHFLHTTKSQNLDTIQ